MVLFRLEFIKELLADGLDVHVVSSFSNADADVHTQLSLLGVTVHHISIDRSSLAVKTNLVLIFKIYKLMKSLCPKYVLTYTIKPVIFGGFAFFFLKIPNRIALITGLGSAFIGNTLKRKILRHLIVFMYRSSLANYQTIFFQNVDDKKLFQRRNIISEERHSVHVVNGSGVNLQIFQPSALPHETIFLMVSRLIADKGVYEYIEAARAVIEEYPATRFKLVGWFDANSAAVKKDEVDNWVREGVVEFIENVKDVRRIIAASSVMVLPSSYREGVPRAILEAMAMSRPIITTDVPGCRETVTEGVNGFLVPAKSVIALSTSMKKFICDPSLIKKMGNASATIAKDKFDVKRVNSMMLSKIGLR